MLLEFLFNISVFSRFSAQTPQIYAYSPGLQLPGASMNMHVGLSTQSYLESECIVLDREVPSKYVATVHTPDLQCTSTCPITSGR